MMMSTLSPPCILPVVDGTTTTTTFAQKFAFVKVKAHKISKRRKIYNKSTLSDYLHQSVNLLTKSDGGPPRWFSPLECASRFNNSPLLLSLPGIDGNGLALMMHYQRLGEIYEIWCLHIPTTDQTPFTDLVKMVEGTVRSECNHSPNRPIYLVGESMGACLALAVAAHAPYIDLVLLLANPVSKSQFQPLVPILKLIPDELHIGIPYLLSLMTGAPLKMISFTDEKGLPLLPSITKISQNVSALFSYASGLADVLTVETLLWKLKMVESASYYTNSRIHNVKAQTLLLCSEKDQLFPNLKEGQRLHRILPKCDIRTFVDKGHALFLEEGFDLVTVIKGTGLYRRTKHKDYVSDFLPPSSLEIRNIYDSLRWLDVATSPVVLSTLETGKIVRGLDGITLEGPVLFVGCHNMLGLEVILMISHFAIDKNIIVRVLSHPRLFTKLKEENLPDVATFDFIRVMGAVLVSASNLYKLLSKKSHVLLYPGGIREALHRKGEEYKLFWPEQPEFIRAAAAFGAKIIPFGAVGEDDFGQMVLDYDDQMKIPFLKSFIEELRSEYEKPRNDEGELANQDIYYPGVLPKLPGRYYYLFGKPIETQGRKQEMRKRENAVKLYSEVKSEIEKCLAYCKRRREEDPYRSIIARFMYQATHGGFDSEVPTFHID